MYSVVVTTDAFSETFQFQFSEGERYRIVSRVDQEVFVNGQFSHRADILNRIAVTVLSVADGTATLEARFQTSERSVGDAGVYEWTEEYLSRYERSPQGDYNIDDGYFMPVVRNVPVFPDRDIDEGESWSGVAEEVHDFRANFGVPDAYRFPIDVSYRFLGKAEFEGRTYDLISIKYAVFHKAASRPDLDLYPIRITGISDELLYWDSAIGRPYHYSEEYDFVLTLSSGDEVEYVGTAEATLVESQTMEKEELAEEIRSELSRSDIENTDVRVSEVGVTVTLEDIQFFPDSAFLVGSEKEKLEIIAEILRRYPGRDILITGHTALAGTFDGRQTLSEERALSVGNFLFEIGARSEDQIVTRGLGATEPVASNNTQEGMRRNRRVEITILEN